MVMKRLVAGRKAVLSSLDVNGDGVVDSKDAVVAAKIVGAAAVGVGATAVASASAGSAIILSGAAAVAAKVGAVAGATAGGFIAASLGTATASFSVVAIGPAGVLLASGSVASAVSAKVLAVSMTAGALIGKTASGAIAGLPIIKATALTNAVAANEVILIAGVPMAVNAALVAGLIAIVIVGGYAYYLLTKDRVDEEPLAIPDLA